MSYFEEGYHGWRARKTMLVFISVFALFMQPFLIGQTRPPVVLDDFQVNDNEGTCYHYLPIITGLADTTVLVLWSEAHRVWSDYSTRVTIGGVARFDVNSNPVSSNLNFGGIGDEVTPFLPDIAAISKGGFVLAWVDGRHGWADVYYQCYGIEGDAIGSDQRANDDPEGQTRKRDPKIASLANGGFVIVWKDMRNGSYDIFAQRFDSSGAAISENFLVSEDSVNSIWQEYPDAAGLPDTGFVIVWQDERNGNTDMYAQRYAADGSRTGNNFRVNDDTGERSQLGPKITGLAGGGYAIAWTDGRNADNDIYAQVYDSSGTAIGINFMVDNNSTNLSISDVCALPGGDFVVSWGANGYIDYNVFIRRFSADGVATGSSIRVNDIPGDDIQMINPHIAIMPGDYLVVLWQDSRNGYRDLYAQIYDPDGSARGGNFKVNHDDGNSDQIIPQIGVVADSGFVITWQDFRNNEPDIYAQHFNNQGIEANTEVKVNDDISMETKQHYPDIIPLQNGRCMITWEDRRAPNGDVYSQRYNADGSPDELNFKLNDDVGTDFQGRPRGASTNDGNILIAWQDNREGNGDIYAQLFESSFIPTGSNFRVNDDLSGSAHQIYPNVSSLNDSRFVVAWQDKRNGSYEIYAQIVDDNGSFIGTNILVNDVRSHSVKPQIASLGTDGFLIVWEDYRNTNSAVYLQRFDVFLNKIGGNVRVHPIGGECTQYSPDVVLFQSAGYLVLWEETCGEPGGNIYGRYYATPDYHLSDSLLITTYQIGSEFIYPRAAGIGDGYLVSTWADMRTQGQGWDVFVNILDLSIMLSLESDDDAPQTFTLHPAHPNPFNPVSTIQYDLPQGSDVSLVIYDILGREVARLVDGYMEPGNHQAQWNGRGFPSGIYIARLVTPEYTKSIKMVLVK